MNNPEPYCVKQLFFKNNDLNPHLISFISQELVSQKYFSAQEDLIELRSFGKYTIFFSNFAKSLYLLESSQKKFIAQKNIDIPRYFIDSKLFVKIHSQKERERTDFFDILYLAFSNDCNLRCKYCATKGGEFKNLNDVVSVKKIIDYVARFKNKKQIIKFLGEGEPSLNFKAINDVTLYIQRKIPYAKIGISTNGVISQKVKEFFLEKY